MQTGGDSFQMHRNKLIWGVVIGVLAVIIIVVAGILFLKKDAKTEDSQDDSVYTQMPTEEDADTETNSGADSTENVSWQWNGNEWQASGTPPECGDPLDFVSPVDLAKVDSILYPGQTRGGNFKPHGGFHLNTPNNTADVKAPMDAKVVHGSRYIEQGEVQYLLFFVNPCGIAYRFDHLKTLSPAMQKLADTLPEPQVDESRTTKFSESVSVQQGDLIATAVGFEMNNNVSFDLGVYDLRQENEASKDASFASQYGQFAEQNFHAICWFDILPADQEATVRGLPATDQNQGKTSAYCK